jgi:hypothetical protein
MFKPYKKVGQGHALDLPFYSNTMIYIKSNSN